MLFCRVFAILALIWLVLMVLFCAAIRIDSVSLLRFPFLVKPIFSCLRCHFFSLKMSIELFFFPFFLVICVLLVFVLLVLFLVAVISLLSCFSMLSSSRYIEASTLYWMLASPFPPFLDTYSLTMLSLGCKALGMVISFLVLCSICLSSSLVHFKNGPEYLTRRQPNYLSLLIGSFNIVLFRVVFWFSRDTLFLFFLSSPFVYGVYFQYF